MKTLRLVFVFLMGLISCVSVSAQDFEVDGIAYSIVSADERTVEVVRNNSSSYFGDVIIPESVMNDNKEYSVVGIGDDAFRYCSSLISLVIPEGVTSIGCRAFLGCSSLISLVIPEGVTSIGGWAFADCSSLSSVVIPESVTSIENSAFADCSSLTSVVIPEGVISIENSVFKGCRSLISVVIPESITSIEFSAFSKCSGLISVVIPESVTSIGGWAFLGCSSLLSVVIPESVASIGYNAFSNCSGLTSIYLKWKNPIAGDKSIFTGIYETATLYIPEGTLQEYRNVEPWCLFSNINSWSSIDSVIDNGGLYYSASDEALYFDGKNISVKVYDINGRMVLDVYGVSSVSVSELPQGTYIAVSERGRSVKFLK